MTKFASIIETVGNTPVVKINRLAPPNVGIYVKVEAFNPLGSVKDRLALGVIEDAERSEALRGTTILAMLPDTGERYLSTPLFADVLAEMNEEEMAIAATV